MCTFYIFYIFDVSSKIKMLSLKMFNATYHSVVNDQQLTEEK